MSIEKGFDLLVDLQVLTMTLQSENKITSDAATEINTHIYKIICEIDKEAAIIASKISKGNKSDETKRFLNGLYGANGIIRKENK